MLGAGPRPLTQPSSFRTCGRHACRGGCIPTTNRIGYASTITPQDRPTSGCTQKICSPRGSLSTSNAAPWSRLAYQFGHELGHVVCNSWMCKVQSPPPSRWLEECLVEAFSIRGIGRLADAHESDPPFNDDREYGRMLRNYYRYPIEKYQSAEGPDLVEDPTGWLRANRPLLDAATGSNVHAGSAILTALKEMDADKGCAEDLGALNRWPERSGVPLEDYLRLWRASCAQIKAPGRLPARLREIFGLRTAGDP